MSNQPDPRVPWYVPPQEPPPGPDDVTVPSTNATNMYRENQRQNYGDPGGNQVESRTEVYEDNRLRKANMRYWTTAVIYFLLAVLEAILGLRFIFRLLGANESNSFILFLYNLSHVFVGPFNGIFNDQAIGNTSVFEVSTLVAMLIYALIGWGLASLCRLIFAPTYSSAQNSTTTWRRQR